MSGFTPRAYESYNRYFGWADVEKGPKGSKIVLGLYPLEEGRINHMEEALGNAPEIEKLDTLMRVVIEKSKALSNVTLEAEEYYDKEDYKDDDFAKGETLHKSLLEAFNEYFSANDEMKVEFLVLKEELFEYEIDKLKKNGLITQYNIQMNMHHAEAILDLLGNLDVSELKSLDVKKYDTQMTKFQTTYDDIEKLAKDTNQIKKEYGDNFYMEYITDYIYESRDFIRETKRLKTRIEKSDFEVSRGSDNGTPKKIHAVYSQMVNMYNRMQ